MENWMDNKQKRWYQRHIQRMNDNYVPVETVVGHCIYCGTLFSGNRKRKYCSNSCKLKHWREQKNA